MEYTGCFVPGEAMKSGGALLVTRQILPTALGFSRAASIGVEVHELASYAVASQPRAGLLLGYGAIATERIEEGLRRLRQCFDDRPAEAKLD